MKPGSKWSTNHHLVVCSIRITKPLKNKIAQVQCGLQDRTGGLGAIDVRKQFASSMAKNFPQLSVVSEDIEKKWMLFRTAIISSAVKSCRQKRIKIAAGCEKRTSWWTQDVKEANRAKKDAFKALFQSRLSFYLQFRYSKTQKDTALIVKMSKKRSWEELGRRLDSNYSSTIKVF